MIEQKASGKTERRIVMGMIVNKVVLSRIAGKWETDAEMFRSKWANIVGNLCVRYFGQYERAPKRAIESLFEAWATERKRDQETVGLVEKFLTGLSSEYEMAQEINAPHLIDMAGEHFNAVKLSRLQDQIGGFIDVGKVQEAEGVVRDYKSVKLGAGGYIDVLQDASALEKAFAEKEEPLLTFGDGLGKFFGYSLKRSAFISFLAPEKVGKTTWLVEMAWRAMLQRKRVAFFSCGDESEDEMMLRFAQRASKRPLYPEELKFPTSLTLKAGAPVVSYEPRDFAQGLHVNRAKEVFARVAKEKLKSDNSYLRLAVHPAGSLSVKGMDDQLEEWAREGYVADVAVCDYMENLDESGNQRDEPRFRIAATWRDMRGLCQRRHLLGLTATQANTAANSAEFLTRAHFSESKTKLAHVTGMAGINQTDEEKIAGIMRLNWVIRRGAFYISKRCCFCAGVMGVQSPAIYTAF